MGHGANGSGANLGFEKTLWEAADKMRGHMDASEYKHVVLGLIFLKYVSDKFEHKRTELREQYGDPDYEFHIEDPDVRWQFGTPPANNANYAWIQHFVHHLAPDGVAGFVMANGSMSTGTSAELEVRKGLVENDLVDCIVAMPGRLFYTTQIPVCLWFLTRDKKNGNFRDRRGHTLFIDAREMGEMIDRTHRTLTGEDVDRIDSTYHAWRGEPEAGDYEDVPGFCAEADLEAIQDHRYILTPGRYVGAAEVEDEGEPFEEKMPKLVARLCEQFDEADVLEKQIRENLEGLGYGG